MFFSTDDLGEEDSDYSNECGSPLNKEDTRIEKWSWLKPEYYGCVIGKDGDIINEIEEESKARITIDNENEKCFITGNEDQRKKAKQLIKEKLDNDPYNYVDDSYTELDFVEPH